MFFRIFVKQINTMFPSPTNTTVYESIMSPSDFRDQVLGAILEALPVTEGAFDTAFNRTANRILIIFHWFMVQFVGTFLCVAVIKVNILHSFFCHLVASISFDSCLWTVTVLLFLWRIFGNPDFWIWDMEIVFFFLFYGKISLDKLINSLKKADLKNIF